MQERKKQSVQWHQALKGRLLPEELSAQAALQTAERKSVVQPDCGGLIWAKLEAKSSCNLPLRKFVWMGVGVVSDMGLPFDALSMHLAAKQLLRDKVPGGTCVVLIPDLHAISTGCDASVVTHRANILHDEIGNIKEFLEIDANIIRASEIFHEPEYKLALKETDQLIDAKKLHSKVSNYTRLGIADAVFMARLGGIKIGWSASPDISLDTGRHHEPEADLLAHEIDPSVAAVYVRHGCRLDDKRPRSAPYLELYNTKDRFMLTGNDSGNFRIKAEFHNAKKGVLRASENLMGCIVKAYENLLRPLNGFDLFSNAEEIAKEVC